MADSTKDTRTAQQIRDDLAAARARMAANVEGLVEEVHPFTVKARTLNDAKSMAQNEFQTLKGQVKDDNGWRVDRLAVVGGAVAGIVAFLVTLRAIIAKVKNSRTDPQPVDQVD